jgi:hypothetical protein
MLKASFMAFLATLLLACFGGDGSSAAAPSSLSYSNPLTARMGTTITPLSPRVTGTVTAYSVSPVHPAGISVW